MRLFELILILTAAASLAGSLWNIIRARRLPVWWLVLILPVIAIHLSFEGGRWQMVPAYLAAAVICAAGVFCKFRKRKRLYITLSRWRKGLRLAPLLLGFVVLTVSGLLSTVLPVFELPGPTGTFRVGTTHLHFTDTRRPERSSGEQGDYRQVPLRLWYPAEHGAATATVPYMTAKEAEALSVFYGLPPFFFNHLTLVQSHSLPDARPAEGPFPLVLFSPSGFESQATVLCEELASNGFVIASVNHASWNAYTRDSSGKIIGNDRHSPYLEQMWREEQSPQTNRIKDQITRSENLEEKRHLFRELNRSMPVEVLDIKEWAADLSFILDRLAKSEGKSAVLNGILNLKKVGVIGFSKGGAAAGQACITDRRICAGINLDGFMFGDITEQDVPCPFMFVHSEPFLPDAYINDLFFERALDAAYLVKVRGSRHANFSDLSLFGPLVTASEEFGPIDGRRLSSILNAQVLLFFNETLKGHQRGLLTEQMADFPEVEIKSKP